MKPSDSTIAEMSEVFGCLITSVVQDFEHVYDVEVRSKLDPDLLDWAFTAFCMGIINAMDENSNVIKQIALNTNMEIN